MVKITIRDELLDMESPQFNQTLYTAEDLSVLRGAIKTPLGDTVEYTGIANNKLSLSFAKFLHGLGVIIEQYDLWIELESEDDEVPVGVFDRTYVDEDGNEQVHTWATWKLFNHTFTRLGDRLFLGTNAHTNEPLTLTQLDGVIDDLVHVTQITQLQLEAEVEA